MVQCEILWYHFLMRNKLFLVVLVGIMLVVTSGCVNITNGKFSQDQLPWKKNGEVLFEEDFSDQASGWEVVNNVYELKGYSPEGYLVSINTSNGRTISTSGLSFTDAEISLNVKKLTGSVNTNFGIVCRYHDRQNYYAFLISADGYAGIYRVSQGQAELLGGDKFSYTDLVKQNDAENSLSALCRGDQLSMEINGLPFQTVTDDVFNAGDAGLLLETNDEGSASALFNDFVVIKP